MTNLILLTLIIGELRRMSPEFLRVVLTVFAILAIVVIVMAGGSVLAYIGLSIMAGIFVTRLFPKGL